MDKENLKQQIKQAIEDYARRSRQEQRPQYRRRRNKKLAKSWKDRLI